MITTALNMKEFKGTKGKWSKNGIDVFVESNPYVEIAQAYSSSDRSFSEFTEMDWEEAHANAQLIATAPELLKELQQTVKALEVIATFGATKPIIDRAKSVIAKALGKEAYDE